MLLLIGSCTPNSPPAGLHNPTPTRTLLTMLTAAPTITPTLPMATPANTMTTQEQKDFFREFLSNNGGCSLPCWWGIIPGQTTWGDAEKTIHRLGGVLVAVFPGYESETTVYGVGGLDLIDITGKPISNDVSFEEKNETVYATHVTSEGHDYPVEFQSVWQNYSPQKIVAAYGMPDRILLNAVTSYEIYGGYHLWFFYDKLGFSIRYSGGFSATPIFHICLGIKTTSKIDLNLQSPENSLPLERFDVILEDIRLGTDTGKLRVVQSLKDATGLNDIEIYNTFIENEEACFDTPPDIWVVK